MERRVLCEPHRGGRWYEMTCNLAMFHTKRARNEHNPSKRTKCRRQGGLRRAFLLQHLELSETPAHLLLGACGRDHARKDCTKLTQLQPTRQSTEERLQLTNVHTPPNGSTHATPFLPYSAVLFVGSSSTSASTMRKIRLDASATCERARERSSLSNQSKEVEDSR